MTAYNPKFLTKNKIKSTSELAASHGNTASNLLKLIDRNELQVYKSISGTTGSRTITWTPATSQNINRIFVQSINWKNFTITYNSGTTFTPDINVSNNADTSLYIEFTAVDVTSVVITVTTTMTSGDTANCGELYIGSELFEMATATAGILQLKPEAAQKILELSDSTSYKIFIRKIMNIEISLRNVTTAERLNYVSLYARNMREPFVCIPWPASASWDGNAWHVNWINFFEFELFENDIPGNNYIGKLELRQASGIG